MNPGLDHLECLRCHARYPVAPIFTGCPDCAARGKPSNVRTRYDLEVARPRLLSALGDGRGDVWRFEALLPVAAPSSGALAPGGTPLVEAPRLAAELGVGRLWIKDESRNPTWSFKDRAAATAARHAAELGAPGLVVASTGNAAAAIAAAAAREGLGALILVASGVDPLMEALARSYGAALLATPTKKDRWMVMRIAVARWGLYPGCNYIDPPVGSHPYLADGYKTTGFEIWEQLGRRAPDWVFAPLGHADNLFGIHRAFGELRDLGLVDRSPRLGGGEVYGSLVSALAAGLDLPPEMPISESTVATSIATPRSTFQALLALRESDGFATRIGNHATLETHRQLAATEGILCEVTSAAGLVALKDAVAEGAVGADSEVVAVTTSAGTKSLAVAPGLDTGADTPLVAGPTEALDALNRLGFPVGGG